MIMALAIYDEDEVLLSSTLHAKVDGASGGVYEFQVKIINDNINRYYTGVQLDYLQDGLADWYDPATDRINVRMFTPILADQTGTRPTHLDWAGIAPADTLALNDIGEIGAGTLTAVPVWIRLFVPGGTDASLLSHGLKLTAEEQVA